MWRRFGRVSLAAVESCRDAALQRGEPRVILLGALVAGPDSPPSCPGGGSESEPGPDRR